MTHLALLLSFVTIGFLAVTVRKRMNRQDPAKEMTKNYRDRFLSRYL